MCPKQIKLVLANLPAAFGAGDRIAQIYPLVPRGPRTITGLVLSPVRHSNDTLWYYPTQRANLERLWNAHMTPPACDPLANGLLPESRLPCAGNRLEGCKP